MKPWLLTLAELKRVLKEIDEKRGDTRKNDGKVNKDDRTPEKYDYLSEHNTNVKKQTVSKYRRLDYKKASPKPTRDYKVEKPHKKQAQEKLEVKIGEDDEAQEEKTEKTDRTVALLLPRRESVSAAPVISVRPSASSSSR